jgi:Protein of unknown function (DUF1073)
MPELLNKDKLLTLKNRANTNNLKTALGGYGDASNNEELIITEINNYSELEYLYLHPIIARFCTAVSEELADSELVLSAKNDINSFIEIDKVKEFFNQSLEAHINENIYGGCLIVADRDEEYENAEKYMLVDSSRAIASNLYDYESYNIHNFMDLNLEVKKENFYKLSGRYLPQRLRQSNQGWGRSLIEIIISTIQQYEGNSKACTTLFRRLNTLVFGIKQFGEIIATENVSGELLNNLQEIFEILEVYNVLTIDSEIANAAYANRSLSGVSDLIEKAKNDLELIGMSTISMPSILLWGKAGRSGLADKGSSELDIWYKSCNNTLQLKILPIVKWMILNYLPKNERNKFKDLEVTSTQLQEQQQKEIAQKDEIIEKALTLKQNRLMVLFDKGLISDITLKKNLNIEDDKSLNKTEKDEKSEIKNEKVDVLDDDEVYIFDGIKEDDIQKAIEWGL